MSVKALDIIKVLLVNVGALTITASQIETGLTIVSLILAICYTLWKWFRDYKKGK